MNRMKFIMGLPWWPGDHCPLFSTHDPTLWVNPAWGIYIKKVASYFGVGGGFSRVLHFPSQLFYLPQPGCLGLTANSISTCFYSSEI